LPDPGLASWQPARSALSSTCTLAHNHTPASPPISIASPARPRTSHLSVVPLPSTRTIQLQHTTAVRRGAAGSGGGTEQPVGRAVGSVLGRQVLSPPSGHGAKRRTRSPLKRFRVQRAVGSPADQHRDGADRMPTADVRDQDSSPPSCHVATASRARLCLSPSSQPCTQTPNKLSVTS
jgi:hypothetical protein